MEGPDPRDESYIDMHDAHPSEVHDPHLSGVRDNIHDYRDRPRQWYPNKADSATKIWRYMDLGQFISLIQTNQLWFSHRSNFEDPYEGRYSKSAAKKILKRRYIEKEMLDEEMTEYIMDDDSDDYVSCWNMKESQSAALWQIYVEGDNGIAIKSTVGALKESLNFPSALEFNYERISGKVQYHTTGDEPTGGYAPIFTKRDIYEHEREYRTVLTSYEPLDDIDVDGMKIKPKIGMGIELDPSILIDEVYISPSASSYLGDVVETLQSDYGPDYPIKKSTVYDDPLPIS
ncbi:hypothetical protein [Saliphagus sp. LR7]|uniref:hypothetical protein n=1 Tax=Saliphagus sp. LR7 TaxID=2282654 RepID=UPI001300984E|nr:hypothetical protein [Saliphagus sp. LR7]